MPELHSGSRDVAPTRPLNGAGRVDPLDALRAADHRPSTTIWREQLAERLRASPASSARGGLRVVGSIAALMVTVAIVWQLFVVTEPPVEDSIPFVSATTAVIPVESVLTAVSEDASAPETNEGGGAAGRQQVVVHVAGGVADPGLVTGVEGWRIDDAVRAAGGAVPSADLDRLNLAAVITDGERIYVPIDGEDEPAVLSSSGSALAGTTSPGPVVVNLNTADSVELQTLPGIGPATAATIVSHREEHGSFGDVDALVAVRGIGPATLEALRDHVRVG